jgi:hypothetical protein
MYVGWLPSRAGAGRRRSPLRLGGGVKDRARRALEQGPCLCSLVSERRLASMRNLHRPQATLPYACRQREPLDGGGDDDGDDHDHDDKLFSPTKGRRVRQANSARPAAEC